MSSASAGAGSRPSRHLAVTGAGRGIGRAIALRLASEAASLSLFARTETELADTAKEARRLGSPLVHVACCDVRDRRRVDECFRDAAEKAGPFDALVANAGIGGPNHPGPEDRFDEIVTTNLAGTYACVRATERHLAPGPRTRHVVLMSSILGRIGVAGYSGYCASKAALLGLARALACELAASNVQVNAVCPGWVDTAMAHEGLEDMARALGATVKRAREIALEEVPLRRMSTPEDVAGVVSWLLSEDARGVTGQGIDVNGGAYMG